jgi:hypothetical protein
VRVRESESRERERERVTGRQAGRQAGRQSDIQICDERERTHSVPHSDAVCEGY